MSTEPWTVSVEDVFWLSGRGVAVIGVHAGGAFRSGDAAELVHPDGRREPVSEVVVDIHSPPGKVAVVLKGLHRGDALPGDVVTST